MDIFLDYLQNSQYINGFISKCLIEADKRKKKKKKKKMKMMMKINKILNIKIIYKRNFKERQSSISIYKQNFKKVKINYMNFRMNCNLKKKNLNN